MINHSLIFLTKKETKYLNYFWAGLIAYTIGFTFFQSGHLNFKALQALQSVGLILIWVSAFNLIHFKFPNAYLKFIFSLYCVWQLLVIFRGLSSDYGSLKKTIFDSSYGCMAYFAPLILLFPQKLTAYKKLFQVIVIVGIFYILYDTLFIRDLLNSDRSSTKSQAIVEYSLILSIPVCFLLLTSSYQTTGKLIFSLAIILSTLAFSVVRARRGLIYICLSQMAFAYFVFLSKAKNKLAIIVITIFIVLIGAFKAKDIFVQNKDALFSFLLSRGTSDTRTGVEIYFYSDLDLKDWIIGKGMNGRYFCPNIDEDASTGYRTVIETGYLQIILNGGIVGLGLLLLIAIPAMMKGLFYSKNLLSKAAGIWILLWITYLYPATMQSFSLYYAIFWISVGACYSKAIRNIPDGQLKYFFRTDEKTFLGHLYQAS